MRIDLKKIFYYSLTFFIIIESIPFTILINRVSAETELNGNAVDAIDSFRITHVYDPNLIYIEWKNGNPDIEGTGELVSGEQVRLYLDWSVKEETTVNPGDYFTFTFPDVFEHSWIETKNNIEITHPDDGIVMARYSVKENNGKKELIVTFTEGVTGHESISGKYELVVFIGNFETITETSLTFEINGNATTINNGITGSPAPPPPYIERGDAKWSERATLEQVINGHYYFKWTIWINFNFGAADNFSINDVIPENSPHVLITPQTIAALGISVPDNLNNLYHMSIREYTGADGLQEDRYKQFQEHLNNTGGWYENYMSQYTLDPASLTFAPEPLDGIDSNAGINLNNFTFFPDGKGFSADLGRVTRPVIIDYYTITTQPFSTNAFYDDATASLIKNTVILNGNTAKSNRVYTIWVDESASIGGIYGNYSFAVKKTDEDNLGLAGAVFSLYTSPDCEGPADRSAESQNNGTFVFGNLKAGTYYIRETEPPDGYELDNTIYKVELANNSCTISLPDGSPVTEIINYTNKPTDEETETEKETEETGKKPYNPPPVELTAEPTTTVSDDDIKTKPEITTLSSTEPTAAEFEVVEESSEIILLENEEIITIPELPDESSADQIDDDLYEIYDDNGIPLGSMTVSDKESIDESNYEDIIDNLIPLQSIDFPDEPTTHFQAAPVQPQYNPQTGASMWVSAVVFLSFSLIVLLVTSKKENN